MQLRDYQVKLIEDLRTQMRAGARKQLCVLPTGGGKTVLIAHMHRESSSRGMPSMFAVHRRELIEQTVETFRQVGIEPGIIASGYDANPDRLVQVASIQTVSRRLHKLGWLRDKIKMFNVDEAHHAVSKSWSKVVEFFDRAFVVGLTATPERLDGKGLGQHFEAMTCGPTTGELIEMGYLSRYRCVVPPGVDLKGVHRRAGDYKREELAAAMGKPGITGNAVLEYLKRAKGKRAIAFHVSIELSAALAQAFREAGVPAEHVDSNTSTAERDAAMRRFRAGETLVLCNVYLFGEGVDVPAAEVGIFMRPTCSLALYLQQVGRVLRPSEGKEYALLIDHAGNVERHGLPCDERDWSLEGYAKDSEVKTPSVVKVCPVCYAAVKRGPAICPICQNAFPVKKREIVTRQGELREMTPEEIREQQKQKRQEQGRARTEDELYHLAVKRGYRNPRGWARMMFRFRQQKKRTGGRG